MSRFSKHLLLFLLINIASGTYFPSSSLSHLIKRYYLHHPIAVIKFFFCCGERSHRTVFAPQSFTVCRRTSSDCSGSRKGVSGSFHSKLGMQRKNSEISSPAWEGSWRVCQSPGNGSAAGGFGFCPLPLHARDTQHVPPNTKTISTSNCQPVLLTWANRKFRHIQVMGHVQASTESLWQNLVPYWTVAFWT